jgi:hypothetical protein
LPDPAPGGEAAPVPTSSAASDFAELSSLRAQLEELTDRVVAVGDRYRDSDDSAIAAELDQAERALRGAVRALERSTGMLDT